MGTQCFTVDIKEFHVSDDDSCCNNAYALFELEFRRGELPWSVYRRFSEFDYLLKYLIKQYVEEKEEVYLPDLPPKTYFNCAYDSEYLECRRILLNRFVESLLLTATKYHFLEDSTLLEFFGLDHSFEVQ